MKICLIVEGCYPYVVGGVSAWVQMLMQRMPNISLSLYPSGRKAGSGGNSATLSPPM